MTDQHVTRRTDDPGTFLTAYRWVTPLFTVLVIVQAFLGMRGFVNAQEGLIDMHEMLANAMFLLAIAQTVMAWLLYTRGVAGMPVLVLNGLLVLLTVAQIGLGYSTRGDSFVTTVSLHVPNGVLLMGISTAVAVMAWQLDDRATGAPKARRQG